MCRDCWDDMPQPSQVEVQLKDGNRVLLDPDKILPSPRGMVIINDEDIARSQQIGTFIPGGSMKRVEVIQNRMAQLEAELHELEKFGEDIYKDGDILTFKMRFSENGLVYSYAALKAKDRWFLTGNRAASYMSWDALVEFWKGKVIEIRKVTRTKLVFEEDE